MIPISVCIIAKNEEENIEKCLQCLSPCLLHPNHECPDVIGNHKLRRK